MHPSPLSRRRFIGQVSAASALAFSSCKPVAEQPPGEPRKKGFGITVRMPDWARRVSELKCSWFYTWGGNIPAGIPEGSSFVPMIWRCRGDMERVAAIGAAAKAAGIGELLGYNEPDKKNQANMTVADALDRWPALEKTGLRLGSPATVHPDNEWMMEFMEGVEKRGLRVDFVCVHSYGGPNPEGLIKRLERVHELFKRPLWLTEFAVGDWNAETVEQNRHSPERILTFMDEVLPLLDGLECLERYAWFSAAVDNRALGTSALFDSDGNLTPLGERYRDA